MRILSSALRSFGSLILTTVGIVTIPVGCAAALTFTTIDVPGATATVATGINDGGTIVGYYYAAGLVHGFIRSAEGVFTTIDYPGVGVTRPLDINKSGTIVGYYQLFSHSYHGFVYEAGVFTNIDVPGAAATQVLGINASGQTVGSYSIVDDAGPWHAFVRTSKGKVTTLAPPGGGNFYATGINKPGQIVGGGASGFLLAAGVYSPIDVGSPSAMNDALQIVGSFSDAAGNTHAFMLAGTRFSTIDPPGTIGPLGVVASKINNKVRIVGWYSDSAGLHGFLAVP